MYKCNPLDFSIMRLRESGLIQQWAEQLWLSQDCEPEVQVEAKSLVLLDTAGIFIMLGVGLGISVLLLTIEMMWYYVSTKMVNINSDLN